LLSSGAGIGYLRGAAPAARVRNFNCSAADLIAIGAVVGRAVTAAELQQALEDAAAQASAWITNARRLLGASPRSEDTKRLFFESFAAYPEKVPTWHKPGYLWADLGGLVARRMMLAQKIIDGGEIRYSCWHSATNCPECPGSSPHSIFACSSFKGDYRICFGAPFWIAFRDGDTATMSSTVMHEALHIYFSRTVSDSGLTGNSNCYERFLVRVNGAHLHGATIQSCPPNLHKGSRGGDVREAQLRLNRWISTSSAKLSLLKVDGIFGSLTEAAVKEFQRKQPLTDDGVIGPLTWAALPGILPMQNGSKGAAVSELQRRLNLWIDSGKRAGLVKLKVDSDFGPKTETVTRAFQTAEGVTSNGVVDGSTWARLPTD
jgi:peptidoglycan hydrolase-like protein with peptidoglycan-binding domain